MKEGGGYEIPAAGAPKYTPSPSLKNAVWPKSWGEGGVVYVVSPRNVAQTLGD